jgi:hypothetical protein
VLNQNNAPRLEITNTKLRGPLQVGKGNEVDINGDDDMCNVNTLRGGKSVDKWDTLINGLNVNGSDLDIIKPDLKGYCIKENVHLVQPEIDTKQTELLVDDELKWKYYGVLFNKHPELVNVKGNSLDIIKPNLNGSVIRDNIKYVEVSYDGDEYNKSYNALDIDKPNLKGDKIYDNIYFDVLIYILTIINTLNI